MSSEPRWIPPTINLPNYRVKVLDDPYRGGYAAKLIGDGIGVIMEPHGVTPGLALMALIRELRQGGDTKLANEIERSAIWLPSQRTIQAKVKKIRSRASH